jgi:uncharacterized protein (UPF0333 family)
MSNKRGQAAMEFLMTYGWAILVVLIAIGALAYFGVLNPGRFLPASCTITPGVSCEDFVVREGTTGTNDNTIQITLRNGMGDDVTSVNVSITGTDGGVEICNLNCTSGCTNAGQFGNFSMPDGELTTWIAANCTDVGTTSSKFKGDIAFAYIGTGGLSHLKTGTITTQVE